MSQENDREWNEFLKTVVPLKKNIVLSKNKESQKSINKLKVVKEHQNNNELIEKIDEYFLSKINEIDKNLLKKIKKTKINEKCTLDLHGYKFVEAREKVIKFIEISYLHKNRLLLIITGKGERATVEEGWKGKGILKENVPKWLASLLLSKYIIWYGQATSNNGGSGAIVIYLKKNL